MSNKTFIPAFRARVGDWNYYICFMKYAEVARQIGFAFELGGNADLSTMIQRGLSERTEAITEYLLESEHRFLGAIIVAAWGGMPQYQAVTMDDTDGVLSGIDREFGVLTFDGTQQFFALDGQHRLRAIKDAIKQDPELGAEDICVLLVPHYDTEDGRANTRRLFTAINRNAKTTTRAENIALDEDDGYAIILRDLLVQHPFLSGDGLVLVFTSIGQDGELKLAGNSIGKTHPRALTTMAVLYDCLQDLGWDLDPSLSAKNAEPSVEVVELAYEVLEGRVDDLLKACGDIRTCLEAADSARDIRAPKNAEHLGHAFMRPVVQRAVTRVCRQIMEQELLTWEQLMAALSELSWRIADAPWTAVYSPERGTMIAGKDFSNLLFDLLYVHLAPSSRTQIQRARKSFKTLRGSNYPVDEAKLMERVPATVSAATGVAQPSD